MLHALVGGAFMTGDRRRRARLAQLGGGWAWHGLKH